MTLRLGPFELHDKLGEGGNGVVYRAVHRTQGTPVAVKVDLHPPDPESVAAFLHEVQIVAALDHPNIAMILDHGTVDRPAQRISEGALREGARWLAMELAMGGTAHDHTPRTWPEVRHLISGLLRALAHAHARGVVHRDIKPQNLLLAGDEINIATRPAGILDARVVLSDFGISEQRDRTALRTEDTVGTPHYMSPEQIEGRWRDQGPWTDLYSVGVLLWKLTTGKHPYKGGNAFQIFRKHLFDPLPRFEPAMPVPEGLEALVARLMAKDPTQRPEFAVEAGRALDALGEASTGTARRLTEADDEAETETQPLASLSTGRSFGARSWGTLSKVPLLHGGRQQNTSLTGAGLALFGMRTVPFVGRDAECDALWAQLVAVRAERRARAVILEGPSGIGKTRLAQWLAHRTHELGVATHLWAQSEADAGTLRDLLRRELRPEGLDADELDDALAARFPEVSFDLRSLAALLAPDLYERPPPSPAEVRQLVISVISELSRERPVVVVLDDVQRDFRAIEMVDVLLTLQEIKPRSLLVVLTVRSEDLVDAPDCEELLRELEVDPFVEDLRLRPLDPDGRRLLIQNMLGLQGALATRIEERTAGNPLFARQLIGAWVEQGILVPGPQGFQLAPGQAGTLPDDVRSVWRSRVDAVLAGRTAAEIESVQVASAIGLEVDHRLWQDVCAVLELEASTPLLDDLRRRHLVHLDDPRGERWSFAHGLVHEAIAERSRAAGHWADHHLAVAVSLRESGTRVRHARLAEHLVAAEVYDQAIEPLCEAVYDQVDEGDLRSPKLVEHLQEVLELLELPKSDPAWGQLRLLRAVRHRARGEVEEAERYAEDVVADAEDYGWDAVRGKALREAARVAWARYNFDRALTRAQAAEKVFRDEGDVVRAADCSYTIAEILSATGRLDEAEARFRTCIEVFTAHPGAKMLHNPLVGMMVLATRRGDPAMTREWLDRCRQHAQPLGLQAVLAFCANIQGEAERASGNDEAARAAYIEAAERYRALESSDFAFPLINLGIMDVVDGRFDAAVQRVQPILVYCRRQPNALFEGYTHMVLTAAHAGLGERDAAADALGRLTSYVSQSSLVDPDLAEMAERAGTLMLQQGWDDEARRALRLASSQYRAAGRPEDAQRVREQLAGR